MNRKIKLFFLPFLFILIPLLIGAAQAGAQGIGLKLYGLYGSIGDGDVYEGLKGPTDWWAQVITLSGFARTGDFKQFDNSWEAGGDLIFYFTPVLGIGLGGGYLQTLPAKTEMTFTKTANPDIHMSMNPKITAIPVRASLYASIPMGSALRLTLHGGASYYFTRMEFAWRLGTDSDWIQVENKADSKGLGFHGGAGLEFNFSSSASLFVEATGRLAKISGFTGDATMSTSGGGSATDSGTLYYWKYDYGPLGIIPEIGIRDPAPSGANYSDVREAEIDLSGFGLRAGFIFRF